MPAKPRGNTSKPRPGDIALLLRPTVAIDEAGRNADYRLKILLKRLLRDYSMECAAIHWYPQK